MSTVSLRFGAVPGVVGHELLVDQARRGLHRVGRRRLEIDRRRRPARPSNFAPLPIADLLIRPARLAIGLLTRTTAKARRVQRRARMTRGTYGASPANARRERLARQVADPVGARRRRCPRSGSRRTGAARRSRFQSTKRARSSSRSGASSAVDDVDAGLDREHLTGLDHRRVAQELVFGPRRAQLHADVVDGHAERVAEAVREQRARDAAIDELAGAALADAELDQHVREQAMRTRRGDPRTAMPGWIRAR